MKSRTRSCYSTRSSTISGLYLKPGALAQLRNSKITAKSKAKENWNQTQILLCHQFNSNSESPPSAAAMEAFPCFTFGFKNRRLPRCLLRKKLIAVTPVFSES